jgi:hypothetical protein
MLIVHPDEIQGLLGHIESLFVFLYVGWHFGWLFPHPGFCLVLVLLQDLFLALGRVVVDGRTQF